MIDADLNQARLGAARLQLIMATQATELSVDNLALLAGWLDAVLPPTIESPERIMLGASVTLDLTEVTWRIAGPAEAMFPSVHFAFDRLQPSPRSLELLGAIGDRVRPSRMGTSLLADSEGVDATWFVSEQVKTADLAAVDGPAGLRAATDVAPTALGVEGDLGPEPFVGGLFELALPGGGGRAEALVAAYVDAGAPPPPAALVVALSDLHDGAFARSILWSDEGVVKVGVAAIAPSVLVMVRLLEVLGLTNDEDLALLQANLGCERPAMIEVESWVEGIKVRAHFDVHVPEPLGDAQR